MHWLSLIVLLIATPAFAGPAEDAALRATEVRDEHCADMAQDRTSSMTGALVAVAPVLDEVSRVYDETGEPYLLYWRGVLLECSNQESRAVNDLQAFAADPVNRSQLPELVRDAERRLRRQGVTVSPSTDTPGAPRVVIALGGAYDLLANDVSPHHYGGVSLAGSFGLVGPLRLIGFGRFAVGAEEQGPDGPQRSALVPFGVGAQARLGDEVAFRIGGLATFLVNQVEDHEFAFTAGATALIGGAFKLGPAPLELRPELELGFLGPLFHASAGVSLAVRL